MIARLFSFSLVLAAFAAPASAQEALRDLCTARPSLGTTGCIVDQGHALLEFGAIDWERTSDGGEREDVLKTGDMLLRYGIAEHAEVQLGWTAFGRARSRDAEAGTRERRTGTGDVTLALRRNLRNPDGSGTSYGVQGFVTLPTGRTPIGAGTWGAGAIVPVSFELRDGLTLVLNPEGDAEPDEDGHGRHLRYGNVAGLDIDLSDAVTTTLEVSAFRDRDPEQHVTELLAALSATWATSRNLQFDAGAIAGLNHHSPDVRLLTGVSARF
jgi:hypothetical protein